MTSKKLKIFAMWMKVKMNWEMESAKMTLNAEEIEDVKNLSVLD